MVQLQKLDALVFLESKFWALTHSSSQNWKSADSQLLQGDKCTDRNLKRTCVS